MPNYPGGVTNPTPTFLVGGDAATSQPAKAACTTAGLALLNGANASAQRTSLGLGSAALAAAADLQVTMVADAAARGAAVPAYVGQLLRQADTGLYYRGTALTAGSWSALDRLALGLGTASGNATGDFATAAQGTKVDQIGVPAAFTTRSLANTDNGKNLICGSAQVATVPTGLASGFGCAFKGIITFTAPGTGVATVTDVRTTGATNPWCALVQTGTDTYDCVGTKA